MTKKNNNSTGTKQQTKRIDVNYLARVEGEGALFVEIEDNEVKKVKLKIFEPPRFFEALLKGRDFREAPDFTARICGICPVAYQMSAVHAMENLLGIKVEGKLADLRRLMYCGEWLESHLLHIYMLHAPDFLGFPDAIKMAQKFPNEVKRGLRMKKAGNSIVAMLGGREIHPINVKVGGFHKAPKKADLLTITDELKWARDAAIETAQWVCGFDFPDFERNYEFVSLKHPHYYPIDMGNIASSQGISITAEEYEDHFEEFQVDYSNALKSRIKARGSYITGPMARYAQNYNNLSSLVKQTAQHIGFSPCCQNPFKSIIVRSLEVVYAFDEAIRIIENYEVPKMSCHSITLKAGHGFGCTEAPRGLLYHHYELDDQGIITFATIVPPTSQNQSTIEEDLKAFLEQHMDLSEKEMTAECERLIRNHDPCISCSAHFLDLKLKRS